MGSHGENHRHSVGARRVRAVPRCRRGRGRGVGRWGTRGGCTCCPDGRLPACGDHRGADMRVGAGEVVRARPVGVLRCEFVCSGGAISASRRCVRVAPIRAGAAAVARGADCFAIARRAHGGRAVCFWDGACVRGLCLRWRGCCPGGRACCLPSATCGIGPGTSFARTSCSARRDRAVSSRRMVVRSLARMRYPSAP